MKNSIILVAVIFISFSVSTSAQTIKAGSIVAVAASTTFEQAEKPFTLEYNFAPVVTLVKTKTCHSVFYGMGNNSLNMLNVYFLPNDWDTYILCSKSLNTSNRYLGWGIEKKQNIGKVNIFQFCEIGTNFQGMIIFSVGIIANLSWEIK